MKKIEIIESIQQRLPQIRPGDLSMVIDMAYSSMVAAEVQENGANNLPYYSTNVVLPSELNALTLPTEIMHIPGRPNSGVVSVVPIGDIRECKPIYTGASSFARNLPLGHGLGAFLWYTVNPDKIIFTTPVNLSFDVWYVKPFNAYHYADEIVVPAGFGEKLYGVVLQLINKSRVKDTANDNVNE